jgi:hypothetical protein
MSSINGQNTGANVQNTGTGGQNTGANGKISGTINAGSDATKRTLASIVCTPDGGVAKSDPGTKKSRDDSAGSGGNQASSSTR